MKSLAVSTLAVGVAIFASTIVTAVNINSTKETKETTKKTEGKKTEGMIKTLYGTPVGIFFRTNMGRETRVIIVFTTMRKRVVVERETRQIMWG